MRLIWQKSWHPGSGCSSQCGFNQGAVIHLTEKAVPVIVIGVPVRYAHTHYGISAYADFDNAVKLACEILKRLDEEQIMSF